MTIHNIIKEQVLMGKKPKNIGFALAKITTEQFAILENNFKEESEIKIQVNIRFAADNKSKLIGVFTTFTFETNQRQFLIIEVGCHFNIESEAWENMFIEESNLLKIPKGFLRHLSVITVGTTRGILHAKTENTPFNKFHLPTINVAELIKEDSVFQFDSKD